MTPRQTDILKAIVEAYAETAEPVGSVLLSKAFNVSSATIRAEMAALERLGLIAQPHTSAGRVPTDKGYRTYVNALQPAEEPSRAAYAIERRIKDSGEAEAAIQNAAGLLVEATHNLAIATWMNHLHRFGLHRLMSNPEFYGGLQALEIARMIDDLPELLSQIEPSDSRVSVFIGSENPIGAAAGASSIIAQINSPFGRDFIGVIGPTRQNYREVVGLVEYVSGKLEEVLNA